MSTTECYYRNCKKHSFNHDPDEGPFCHEDSCIISPKDESPVACMERDIFEMARLMGPFCPVAYMVRDIFKVARLMELKDKITGADAGLKTSSIIFMNDELNFGNLSRSMIPEIAEYLADTAFKHALISNFNAMVQWSEDDTLTTSQRDQVDLRIDGIISELVRSRETQENFDMCRGILGHRNSKGW